MNLIEKNARVRSKDPMQESLKERKSEWNEKTSKFITLLIALKQGLNGKPVPALNIPAGRLHEPMPDSVINLIGQMAGVYDELTQTAQKIVQEQQSHAEQVNQRRQEKQAPSIASRDIDTLIKEASNPLSRLWTYIKTPFNFSDEDRYIKKNLIQNLVKIDNLLKEIQLNLADRSENTVPKAVYLTKDMIHNFLITIISPINQWYRKKGVTTQPVEPDIKDKSKELPQDDVSVLKENVEKMWKHHGELFRLTNGIQDETIRDMFHTLLREFSVAAPLFLEAYNRGDFDKMQEHYGMMVQKLELADQTIQKYRQEVSRSFIEKDDLPIAAKNKVELEKLAQSQFKTWFLRKWLSLWSSRDSSIRKGALSLSDDMKRSIDKMITMLQSSDVDLNKFIAELIEFVKKTASYLVFLADLSDAHTNRVKMTGQVGKERKGQLIPESDIRMLRRLRIRMENSLDVGKGIGA